MKVSLIMPSKTSGKSYCDFAYNRIRELYPDENKVEVIIRHSDTETLGDNYNYAVKQATGDIIVLIHNDMYLCEGFIEDIIQNSKRGRVLCYSRVEPPIFPGESEGKYIIDCGNDIDSFNKFKFNNINIKKSVSRVLNPGFFCLLMSCYKDDYLLLDGHTFRAFLEDTDLFLRYKIANFEIYLTSGAFCYHFVSKTSRVKTDSFDPISVENESMFKFIKKWGFRNYNDETVKMLQKSDKDYLNKIIYDPYPSGHPLSLENYKKGLCSQ